MNAILSGKPDAGNPHVAPTPSYGGTGRFDEEKVAPTKPLLDKQIEVKTIGFARLCACLLTCGLALAALAASTAKTVDELEGLRPDTEGVETNKFWDTRAHLSYTVQTDNGASTNAFDTAVLTQAASEPGAMGKPTGIVLIVR